MKMLYSTLMASGLALGFLPAGLRADEPQLKTVPGEGQPAAVCRHSTAIDFVATPAEAAKLAARAKKLVLVLHVSGYFEDPDFT
jgi:hypothetical protein